MNSPGESLKREREAHGRTIEQMAEATGILPHLLTALEQEAFDDLPGRGFGKLYIRAYAEVLGFDPRPVIEAYDWAVRGREAAADDPAPATTPTPVNAGFARWRQERLAGRARAVIEGAVAESEPAEAEQEFALEFRDTEFGDASEIKKGEAAVPAVLPRTDPGRQFIEAGPPPLPVEAASPSRPARSRRWLVASLLLFVLLPLMAYLVFLRSTPDTPPPVAAREETAQREAAAPPPPRPLPPPAAAVPRTPPRTPTPRREEATPSPLEVVESGVGLRIVAKRLEGEGDRFRAGQRVTFATRVHGGRAGDSILHVWLRDGNVEQSIRLDVGSASWRTHSTKTLGRAGAWAVEARDEQGRVLARADLAVVP